MWCVTTCQRAIKAINRRKTGGSRVAGTEPAQYTIPTQYMATQTRERASIKQGGEAQDVGGLQRSSKRKGIYLL